MTKPLVGVPESHASNAAIIFSCIALFVANATHGLRDVQQSHLREAAWLTCNLDQAHLLQGTKRTRLRCAVNAERLEI